MFHAMSVDMPHLEDTVDSSTVVPGSKTQNMLDGTSAKHS